MAIKNGFRGFWWSKGSFLMKDSFQKGKARFCTSTGL